MTPETDVFWNKPTPHNKFNERFVCFPYHLIQTLKKCQVFLTANQLIIISLEAATRKCSMEKAILKI